MKNTCETVTGISDIHELTAVSLKSQILKAPPSKQRLVETIKHLIKNKDLKSKLDLIDKLDYLLFESIFIDDLNTNAPVTTKTVRANNHQFMTKTPSKAIMTRSRLKNAYLNT